MLRLAAETGVGVVLVDVLVSEGDGDGVTVMPSARLTPVSPSAMDDATSSASPTQMAFAIGNEGACRAHLPASCLGSVLRLFTIGDFRAVLGAGRDWQSAESVTYQRCELAAGPIAAAQFVALNADNRRFERFVPR